MSTSCRTWQSWRRCSLAFHTRLCCTVTSSLQPLQVNTLLHVHLYIFLFKCMHQYPHCACASGEINLQASNPRSTQAASLTELAAGQQEGNQGLSAADLLSGSDVHHLSRPLLSSAFAGSSSDPPVRPRAPAAVAPRHGKGKAVVAGVSRPTIRLGAAAQEGVPQFKLDGIDADGNCFKMCGATARGGVPWPQHSPPKGTTCLGSVLTCLKRQFTCLMRPNFLFRQCYPIPSTHLARAPAVFIPWSLSQKTLHLSYEIALSFKTVSPCPSTHLPRAPPVFNPCSLS